MTFLPLSRRSALKGMGVSIALPFLEAMLPRTVSARGGTVGRRFLSQADGLSLLSQRGPNATLEAQGGRTRVSIGADAIGP